MSIITVQRTEFADFEALQDIVQDNRSEVMQIGPGRMSGRITHLSVGTFGISTGEFSRGIRARGLLSPTRWSFVMMLESKGSALVNGHQITAGDVMIVAPGQERYTRFPDSTRYSSTLIEPDRLRSFLDSQPGAYQQMEPHRVAALIADQATAAANVRQLLPLVDALAESGPAMPDHTVEFYQRNILELLTASFRDASSRYLGVRPPPAERLVRKVDAYLKAAGNRPVHISELCEQFKVARRTLFHAFHDVLGIPPIQFMRHKRLSRVHAALSQGGHVLIRNVAIAHGFLEQGKFAREYRHLFGERPSETLRRAQGRLAETLLVLGWWISAISFVNLDPADLFPW